MKFASGLLVQIISWPRGFYPNRLGGGGIIGMKTKLEPSLLSMDLMGAFIGQT